MAGRVVYVWDAKTGALVARYDDGALRDDGLRHVLEKKRYNVPPASHLPLLCGEPGGEVHVRVARWGFPIPQRPNGVFNTRIESATTSPMWRGLLGRSHGLFFLQGYYEWRTSDKRPFFIHRADGEVLLLAALVGQRTVDGEAKLCSSILTCEPNPGLAPLHDRMPIVIEERDARQWLHASAEEALAMARPAPDGRLAFHEVGPDVSSFRNDRPDLPLPIANAPSAPQTP